MNKYPFLKSIRVLIAAFGWLTVVAGVLAGLLTANSGFGGFSFVAFLITAAGGLASGGTLIAFAELISVFLDMESHMDRSAVAIEQLNRTMASARFQSAASSVDAPAPTAKKMADRGQTPAIPSDFQPSPAPADGPHLRGRVVFERTMLKAAPNRSVVTVAMSQHEITVVGRSADGGWLQVYKGDQGPYWTEEGAIEVSGDVATLPITFGE